jgi:hypothetical protein
MPLKAPGDCGAALGAAKAGAVLSLPRQED